MSFLKKLFSFPSKSNISTNFSVSNIYNAPAVVKSADTITPQNPVKQPPTSLNTAITSVPMTDDTTVSKTFDTATNPKDSYKVVNTVPTETEANDILIGSSTFSYDDVSNLPIDLPINSKLNTALNTQLQTEPKLLYPENEITNQINIKVKKIRNMCEQYSNAEYLSYINIAQLMMEIAEAHQLDPQNSQKYLSFVKIVRRNSNLENLNPIFIADNIQFDQLKHIVQELLHQKYGKYAICYWNGIHYKDGISFQVYGSHNIPDNISPSRCYDEIIKTITTANGIQRSLAIYSLLPLP